MNAPEPRNKDHNHPTQDVHFESPSQPSDPQVDDLWTDTNSGETFRWNGTGWVQEGFDPEHPVPDAPDAE